MSTLEAQQSSSIKQVLITGGTHGNEMSGIQAVQYWQNNPGVLRDLAPTATTQVRLVNTAAMAARARYIDEDLNRQFTLEKLGNLLDANANNEVTIAHAFNAEFGPKGNPKTDFQIDIHNTTSNMGPTLIVLENDDFHQQLARYVKKVMPESIILVEDYKPYADFGYLCTVAKRGVMVEVGPQVQGALKASIYQQTIDMTYAILGFIERFNTKSLSPLSPASAYRLGTEIFYPTNAECAKTAMIHPSLEGMDFKVLMPQQPCFIDFEGKDILWEGDITYPHFIGEAAYDHLHIAFATSTKCKF